MRRITLSLLLAAAVLSAVPSAAAQSPVEQAKLLFKAGEQAYLKTNYRKAIQAFTEANRLAPRPAVLFSMAQAYRQVYALEQQPEDLRQAVDLYRQYVAQVPQGGRRADAVQALVDLGPAAARLAPDLPAGPGQAPAPAPPPPIEIKAETLLSVMCATAGSKVSVDGKEPVPTPIMAEVEPGPHKVKLTADGFIGQERDVVAAKGKVSPVDVTLLEVPARVTIKAPASAQVSVDGQPVGSTPLLEPLKLSSGDHFIAVTKNGYKPFTQDVTLARAKDQEIEANLSITGQRVIAYSFFGAGAAGIGVGIVATVVVGFYSSQAQLIQDASAKDSLSVTQRDDYNRDLENRDTWTRVAGAGYALGAAFGAGSLLLYAFDQPTINRGSPRLENKSKPAAPPPVSEPAEFGVLPAWSPGFLGAMATGRF